MCRVNDENISIKNRWGINEFQKMVFPTALENTRENDMCGEKYRVFCV